MSIEIVARLSKIIFASDDGTYQVGEFVDQRSARRFRASGRVVNAGKSEAPQAYRLFGDWQSHPKYGTTFAIVYCEPVRPDTLAGIGPFLVNNVKGVGETTAKKFLQALDVRNLDQLLQICREKPEVVFEFFKGKRAVAQAVISVLTGNEIYRSIMVFLHEHNIPTGFASRIYEKYGNEAIRLLTENPYRLISDFKGVGFVRADAIALKLGIEPTSIFRMEAAFVYALEMAREDGHCCLPRDALVRSAADVLGGKQDPRFSFEFVLSQLRAVYKRAKEEESEKLLLRAVPITDDAGKREMFFYLPQLFHLENKVASRCLGLIEASLGEEHLEKIASSASLLEKSLPDVPWEKLSDEQHAAVLASVTSRIMVLTGGPGCGKTFVLRAIHQVQMLLKRKTALCAPTGLAAKRMSLSIGAPASTIHKLLRLGQGGEELSESEESSLDGVDVVIVDEASMLGLELFHTLLEALGPQRRLILVGDVDQLPSVNAGNCLRDIISSERVEVVRLTKIFRQSSESPIPLAARQIMMARKPDYIYKNDPRDFLKPEPLAFVPCNIQAFHGMLMEFLRTVVPNVYGLDPLRNCQILVPMRKGEAGQEKINQLLQRELNPSHESKKECQLAPGVLLREGDKVIQTKNNYDKEVFNGDLGFCRTIRATDDKLEVEVEFHDRMVTLEDEEVEDLQLCYAMTIHKSQGSEFQLCIIPMFSSYYMMLDRNLLYTALTRASKYAILMGEDWAVRKAVGSSQATQRFTCLQPLLRADAVDALTKPV